MDVIIAPSPCKKLITVRLPSPKDGQGQQFFYDEENLSLHEIMKYSDKYRSWFIDNLLCSDGHFNMMTQVDPLYIFIPHLIKYCGEKFRSLDDICEEYKNHFIRSVPDSEATAKYDRLDYALSPGINWTYICETKDIDGDLFLKFSQTKAIEWLMKKHDRLMEALKDQLPPKASKATLISYATDHLSDYIPTALSEELKKSVKNKYVI